MINNKHCYCPLWTGLPTIRETCDSDEHEYADQEIGQRDPPAEQEHICYISTCDQTTCRQRDRNSVKE